MQYGSHILECQDGAQHGYPLSHVLFCLAVHPLLTSPRVHQLLLSSRPPSPNFTTCSTIYWWPGRLYLLRSLRMSPLSGAAWYRLAISELQQLIPCYFAAISEHKFAGFARFLPDQSTILWAQLMSTSALDISLNAAIADLKRAMNWLQLTLSHNALVLNAETAWVALNCYTFWDPLPTAIIHNYGNLVPYFAKLCPRYVTSLISIINSPEMSSRTGRDAFILGQLEITLGLPRAYRPCCQARATHANMPRTRSNRRLYTQLYGRINTIQGTLWQRCTINVSGNGELK